jgi:hypothetical protein
MVWQSGWPVEVTDRGFATRFPPWGGGPPPWRLYRLVFPDALISWFGPPAPAGDSQAAEEANPCRRS